MQEVCSGGVFETAIGAAIVRKRVVVGKPASIRKIDQMSK